jgi:hypothetical protein
MHWYGLHNRLRDPCQCALQLSVCSATWNSDSMRNAYGYLTRSPVLGLILNLHCPFW